MEKTQKPPRSLVNVVIVEPDLADNQVELGSTGIILEIATQFNVSAHAIISGTVAGVPDRIETNTLGEAYDNEMQLRVGDKVYFHYNMIRPETQLPVEGQKWHWMFYEAIFCFVRDGELCMVGDHIFAQPIYENEHEIRSATGIWLTPEQKARYLMARAKILGIPKRKEAHWWTDETGYPTLQPEDAFIYKVNSDINITVQGETYYRMKYEDALVRIDGEVLEPLGNNVIVIPAKKPKQKGGIIIPDMAKVPITTGVVFKAGPGAYQVRMGDRVYFEAGRRYTEITIHDVTYWVFQEENLLLVCNDIEFEGEELHVRSAADIMNQYFPTTAEREIHAREMQALLDARDNERKYLADTMDEESEIKNSDYFKLD